MKLRILATLILSLILLNSEAKENPFILKLKSGDELLTKLDENLSLAAVVNNLNSNYFIVQFYDIPTEGQKVVLKNNGIDLLEYIPNKSFISNITNASAATLANLGIRSIKSFEAKYKTSADFNVEDVPDYALYNSTKISLLVNIHIDTDILEIESYLNSTSINLIKRGSNDEFFEIATSKENVNSLLNQDFVKFVEFIPAPPEKEDTRARGLHRNNLIDSDHPLGRKYDGTGVSISIADDGAIGPHIDLKGRFTQPSMPDRGTHGDMTTGIAMGAGNLDPRYRGMATGAFLYYYDIGGYPHISNAVTNLNTNRVVITSTSYSEGCNAGYTTTTRQVDQQTRQNEELLHVFSAGNSAGSTCGGNAYGAGTPWGTITGGRKQGKAVIATGNLDYRGFLTSSSSRGPARDGRIKPDICSNGTNQMSTDPNNSYSPGGGTSAAAPGIAGISAQLYDAYRSLNNGNDPNSGLIKASMLNTARDLGNRGPDFFYGWGRVNAYKALKLIEDQRYSDSSIAQGVTNAHTLNIPSNIEQLRVMVYWTDFESTVNASRALVNDLDIQLVTPLNDTIKPWVLNTAPNATALNTPSTRGVDNLNNMEQVTIDTVPSGNYTVLIEGKAVPNGPQQYFVLWENVKNEIDVTYPHGGEAFVQGETETIRWDAYGNTGTFLLEYSSDSGLTWNNIGTVSGTSRYYDWRFPSVTSGDVLVRITRGSVSGVSENSFSIMGLPTNIGAQYICPDSIKLRWNGVTGATSYIIYTLGAQYMDSIGVSATTDFSIYNLNLANDNWFAVKAIGNGIQSRRSTAVLLPKAPQNCPLPYDIAIYEINSPGGSYASNCSYPKLPVTITLNNQGDSILTNVPLRLRVNNTIYNDTFPGPLARNGFQQFTFRDSINVSTPGNINLSVIADLPNDANELNDSLGKPVSIIPSTVFTLPYSNDFENFPFCAITSNCGGTICSLNGGWINLTNGVDDDFDMRVNAGGTPSTGTGPTFDQNPGTTTGKYIYSEASGTCSSVESEILTPCFDLTNTITPELSFWYHSFGTSTGNIRLDIFANGRWNTNIMTPTFGSNNSWQQRIVNLSAYAGQRVTLRFRVTTGPSWSSDIAIDNVSLVDRAVSVSEVISNERFSIYPNPSNGSFTIEFTNEVNRNLRVYDIHGRVVHQEVLINNSNQINLSSLRKGIYIIDLDEGKEREKIIIQ